jgi:hypothetical protein
MDKGVSFQQKGTRDVAPLFKTAAQKEAEAKKAAEAKK